MNFLTSSHTESTEWPKRHDIEIKIEFLPYKSTKEVDFFPSDRGTSKLYIHMKIVENNLC